MPGRPSTNARYGTAYALRRCMPAVMRGRRCLIERSTGEPMLNLLLLLSITSIALIAGVIVFLGLAWLVVAVPVVLLMGGGSGAFALRRWVLARRAASAP